MKDVEVLGPGCKRCVTMAEMVQSAADKLGVAVKVEKVTDYAAIAAYGIASTPGVVIDGKFVHAGGLPKAENSRAGWRPRTAPFAVLPSDNPKKEELVSVQRGGTFLRYSANAEVLQEILAFLYAECRTRNKAFAPRENHICIGEGHE